MASAFRGSEAASALERTRAKRKQAEPKLIPFGTLRIDFRHQEIGLLPGHGWDSGAVARWTDVAGEMKRGEPDAHREFAIHFGPRLRGLFRALCAEITEHEAEDLAVSCISDIITKKLESFRFEGSFESWVLTVAHHMLNDWIREKQRFQPAPLDETLIETVAETEPHKASEELVQVVNRALGTLSRREQSIIRMRYFTAVGYTFYEIALELNSTEGAVKLCHWRALGKLGAALKNKAVVRDLLKRREAAKIYAKNEKENDISKPIGT